MLRWLLVRRPRLAAFLAFRSACNPGGMTTRCSVFAVLPGDPITQEGAGMFRAREGRTLIARAGPVARVIAISCIATLPLLTAQSVLAQGTGSVRGLITDANQRPLAGAQVVIKGTQRGRVTDATGVYTI